VALLHLVLLGSLGLLLRPEALVLPEVPVLPVVLTPHSHYSTYNYSESISSQIVEVEDERASHYHYIPHFDDPNRMNVLLHPLATVN
jgi:hypothetical protein